MSQSPPVFRLPLELSPTDAGAPRPPAGPDGSLAPIVIANDLAALTVGQSSSNRTVDLNGHEVLDLVLGDGLRNARVTNGRVGTVRSQSLAALTPERPNAVVDVIVDNLLCTGRGPHREGNQLRGERLLLSDLKTVAASARGVADGFEAYAMWLDYGSKDILLQDCNLWTRGGQAALRAMACKRLAVSRCVIGSVTESYAARFHGPSSSSLPDGQRDTTPSEDNGLYHCLLRGRGLMVGAEPDGTERWPDITRRFTLLATTIDMTGDGAAGQDASLMLPSATPAPTGQLRLVGLRAEGLRLRTPRAYNPLAAAMATAQAHPELQWAFADCQFLRA